MKTFDGRKLKYDVLTELRKRAVARVQSGESPEEVVRTLGFSRPCIYTWLAMYRAGGWDALNARKRGGRKRKLSAPMIKWVYQVGVGSDPRQYKFPFALWTRQALAILIYREYKIRLSRNSVGRLLAQLGITPQKPLWRAYQQDPERVRRWLEQEYPAIVAEARKIKGEIWFLDEAGIRSDYHAGTTWGIKGQTPAVRSTGARLRLNLISAVNRKGKMRFMLEKGAFNNGVMCRFLDRLMVGCRWPIFLILDRHPVHLSKEIADKVRSFQGSLRIFFLPPYSPELNPDEGVWTEVKSKHIGRAGVFNMADLEFKAMRAMRHMAHRPDKIRALFHKEETRYAA
jgi:transposase